MLALAFTPPQLLRLRELIVVWPAKLVGAHVALLVLFDVEPLPPLPPAAPVPPLPPTGLSAPTAMPPAVAATAVAPRAAIIAFRVFISSPFSVFLRPSPARAH